MLIIPGMRLKCWMRARWRKPFSGLKRRFWILEFTSNDCFRLIQQCKGRMLGEGASRVRNADHLATCLDLISG